MLIDNSKYKIASFLKNKHLHTVIPSLFFKHKLTYSSRERVKLPDNDFLEIDLLKNNNKKVVLLLHGLESSANQFYIKHTADVLAKNGYDIVAINYRGCGGEPNNLYKGYHSGCSDDLNATLKHINLNTAYQQLYIVGFSLGGNILLKYLAEYSSQIPSNFVKAVAFSTPIDLKGTSLQLSSTFGGIYQKHFLKKLIKKLTQKVIQYPQSISLKEIKTIKTLHQFDGIYTAPANGFKHADDYYEKCSSKPLLKDIKHPVLLINALDDPFLPESCYPYKELKHHPFVDLETPKHGGHLGFILSLRNQTCWYPQRILTYFNEPFRFKKK